MSKVLVESENDQIVTAVSIRNELLRLENQFNCLFTFKKSVNICTEDIQECDILLSIRPNSPLSYNIINLSESARKFIIVFYDDNLMQLPHDYIIYHKREELVCRILAKADVIYSCNYYLASKFAHYTTNHRFVIKNTAIDVNDISSFSTPNNNIVKIVYAAGRDHEVLFENHVLPALIKIAGEMKLKFQLDFIGVKPDTYCLKDYISISFIPPMSLSEFRFFIASQHYDIGLAPFNNDEFSRCKYYNKFIEYTLAGIFGIYSDCEPNNLIVRNSENGLLSANTTDDWTNSLGIAILNKELREKCVANAQNLLKKEYTDLYINSKFIKDIPELIHYTPPQFEISKFCLFKAKNNYRLFKVKEYFYLSFMYIYKKGFAFLIKKILDRFS